MTPAAVIFDWDDTLVDTWPVVRHAINATLEHFGHKPWSEDEARKRIGPPARVLFSQLFGEDRWQEADEIYIAAYKSHIAAHIRLHEGVRDTLETLKSAGIPMAVVSTKRGPLLREEAAQLGLASYFVKMVGAGDAPADKPHADAVYFALKETSLTISKEVIFIGDSVTDMITAENAGCTGILIETKPPAEDALAAHPPAYRMKDHRALALWLKQNLPVKPPANGTKPSAPF